MLLWPFPLVLAHCRAVRQGVLDNLLKGAATQCLQNLNLALGLDVSYALDPHRHRPVCPIQIEPSGVLTIIIRIFSVPLV